jgi:DNA-binding MarR family transcriptional regulator
VAGDGIADELAGALGQLLLRNNRARLYDSIVEGIGGVDATTYPVLSGLARVGPATASELAGQIGLDRTVTTRYATRLEAAGLIERVAHPTDARATQLSLTPTGRRAIASMRTRLSRLVRHAISSWTVEEQATFVHLLHRFTDSVSAGTFP